MTTAPENSSAATITRSGTTRRRSRRRPAMFVAAALVAATVGQATGQLAGTAPEADAAVYSIRGSDRANVRSAPSTSARIVRVISPGTRIDIACQGVGDRFGSGTYAENRTWNRLTDGTWVHDMLTSTPGGRRENLSGGGYAFWTPSLPRCGNPAPPPPSSSTVADRAVAWALARQGDRSYDYWCLRFVVHAYSAAGRPIPSAEWAKQWWDQRPSAQRRGDLNPPKGALVFWSWVGTLDGVTRDWGHVGISLGDGRVVSSKFRTGSGVHVFRLADARASYLGWIMP